MPWSETSLHYHSPLHLSLSLSLSVCVCVRAISLYTVPSWSTILHIDLDFLRPITTAEAFEAVDWLADLPQRT